MAIDIEKLKAAAIAANQAWMDEPYEIEPALVLELIERLESSESEVCAQNKQLSAKDEWITSAITRLEAAEKDAARYRWLRQQESWIPNRSELPAPFCGAVKWVGSAYSENEIDDLIDYAIASVEEQEK